MSAEIGCIAGNFVRLLPLFYEKFHTRKRSELTSLQIHILESLIQCNERISMTQLSIKMDICKQQLTTLICKLEEKKYVVKQQDEKDRRIMKLSITPKGEDVVQEHWAEICKKISTLTKEELSDLEYASSKMLQIINKIN
ncbi:MarR family winged helix-turn-helix transcriptional regulator [Shimazuella kribbensis]|uniref:MarR family winged helix-turn-helix transcriptional regulator n=1 Tax=Shimazuella kribbensis TaxID=139808 RepID=UPI000416EB26|nr:MarR family transcriptional regulator [Shimazuella kribbensis]